MTALKNLVRTYPVTLWLGVGVATYAWKASLVATMYSRVYTKYDQERIKELQELK